MNWDRDIEGSTLKIAGVDAEKIRVVAGPGTGKSYALQRRVMRLLELGHNPSRILVVTFTRTASDNLVQKLATLKVPNNKGIRVGTLHSYCFSILNKENVLELTDRVPRIIKTFGIRKLQFEGRMLINDLARLEKFGGMTSCNERILAFEAAWARLESDQPGWPSDPVDAEFQNELNKWLHFHDAMLLGELVPVTLRYLYKNPASDVLELFDHVIVDEYQDLNKADQEVINLLSRKGNLMIVGDPDQSIYSFRHAHPDGIKNLRSRYPAIHDETLEICRRCPVRIVSIANQLIKNNYPSDTSNHLHPMPDAKNGTIHIVQWKSMVEEARGIAEYVQFLLTEKNYTPDDILILAPRRPMAYLIRGLVQFRNIPIHSFYREEILEKNAAQRAIALLTLLDNKEDRVALRWWLGKTSQSGLSVTYQKLREYCEETGRHPIDVLENIAQGNLLLKGMSSLLHPFRELIAELDHISALDLPDLIDRILPENNDECKILREVAERFLDANTDSSDVGHLLSHIQDNIIELETPKERHVKIMSLQKSKGLTSKVVIVAGCIEGLIPGTDAKSSGQNHDDRIREYRRLFYVAVTRSNEVLVLSSFANADINDAKRMKIPFSQNKKNVKTHMSRFVDELGSDAPPPKEGEEWKNMNYQSI